MKKLLILAALVGTQAFAAPSDERDTWVGFCGAFHLIKAEQKNPTSNYNKVSAIAAMASNKNVSQAAANHYVKNFTKDIGHSIRVGENACSLLGVN